MDWSKSKKKTKPRVPLPRGATSSPRTSTSASPASSFSRSRSNSFVLSMVFDETIERESKLRDTPTHLLTQDDGEDIIKLQDIEYDFGSEWLVKSPPQKKRHTRNQSESDNGVARHRLPPLPRKNQKGKTSTALGKGTKPKPAVARRVSSLPKPIQQVPKQQETRRNAQTQTDAAAARGAEDPSRQGQRRERDDIVREVRMCGDLVLEMVSDACELGELYKKERRRGSRRRQGGCCCAVM